MGRTQAMLAACLIKVQDLSAREAIRQMGESPGGRLNPKSRELVSTNREYVLKSKSNK